MNQPPIEKDVKNLRVSEKTNSRLTELKEDGFFNDKQDAYRLAISLAIFHEFNLDTPSTDQRNIAMYSSQKVDDTGSFKKAISVVYPSVKGNEYRAMEVLAELGFDFMYNKIMNDGMVDMKNLMEK